MELIIFFIVLSVVLLFLWLGEKRNKKQQMALFSGRENLSKENFFKTYYADSGISMEVVLEVIDTISIATGVPKEKIRPSDRFDHEFKPSKGWEFDAEIAGVEWFIKKKMKKAGVSKLPSLNTVDDLIKYTSTLSKIENKKKHSKQE